MEKAIEKAKVLLKALPYINAFKGKIVVIKYGGAALDDPQSDNDFITDIIFLASVGIRPILVHGGGKHISRRLKEEGVSTEFVNGLRVTDAQTIKVVEEVLAGEINSNLVQAIEENGGQATGISGVTGRMIRVTKLTGKNEDGTACDWGYVGDVVRVNPRPLFDILMENRIPVVAPLGIDEDGQHYNVNADTIAAEIASSLTVEKLMYITDVDGILRDENDPKSLISTIDMTDVPQLKADGILRGGMLPKVDACVHALKNHVHKTHIVSGRVPHSILLEIFTDKGCGTEIISTNNTLKEMHVN